MNCVRCGKETEGKAVFCPECLEEMERYPVKPGTIIHIRQRPEADTQKPVRKKRELSTEQQLKNAVDLIQFLVVLLMGMFTTLVLTGVLLYYSLSQAISHPQPEGTQPLTGRNYSTVIPANE